MAFLNYVEISSYIRLNAHFFKITNIYDILAKLEGGLCQKLRQLFLVIIFNKILLNE